jgi:hypothetical protein
VHTNPHENASVFFIGAHLVKDVRHGDDDMRGQPGCVLILWSAANNYMGTAPSHDLPEVNRVLFDERDHPLLCVSHIVRFGVTLQLRLRMRRGPRKLLEA